MQVLVLLVVPQWGAAGGVAELRGHGKAGRDPPRVPGVAGDEV